LQAIEDGVARKTLTFDEAYNWAKKDIEYAQSLMHTLMEQGFIESPPDQLIDEALQKTLSFFK